MSWKQKALALAKLCGPAAKFAAKAVLGAVLPGSPAVVELVEQALDCAHETAKEKWEIDEGKEPAASAADLRRLEEVLDVLGGDLSALMARVAALESLPDVAQKVLNTAIATDDHLQSALHKLTALAMRFDRLEEQNRRLLQAQGYAAGMLEELLPLVRRLGGVADFVAELRAQGVGPVALRSALGAVQAAVAALAQGKVAEASAQARAVGGRLPNVAAAQVARAAVLAVGHDLPAAEACLTSAARLRPDDRELHELQRRVTRATALETPRGGATLAGKAPRVGDVLDGWTLEALLGQGGWGQVFRASKGERRVALKVMRPELSGDPMFAERFRREILILAGLRGLSRSLVEIHDFGYAVSHGCWYFVMEYVKGMSLEHYLAKKGPLTLEQAMRVFVAVAKGLAVAHDRGVVHRDIKPANILLRRDGRPVLVDFGLAAQESGAHLTRTGEVAGYTAMFAAPEQLRGKPADARSDVYGLAGSLYYALTYDRPQSREPEHFEPGQTPEAIRELLESALDRRSERRPANAAAFVQELKRVADACRPRRVEVTVPGTWYVRPADAPEADWEFMRDWDRVGATPGEVIFEPGRVYGFQVARDARDDQLHGLIATSGLKAPRLLSVYECPELTDAGLAYIGRLSALEELDFLGCPWLTDAGLAQLTGLTALRKLCISGCKRLTDAGLAHIGRLGALRRLSFGFMGRAITGAGLAFLNGLTELRELNFWESGFTEEGLIHIGGLTALQVLRLTFCVGVTDAVLAQIGRLTALEDLDLGDCSRLTDAGFAHVGRLNSLHTLNVGSIGTGAELTDDGLRHLGALAALCSLYLKGMPKLTNTALAHIGSLASLQELRLRRCPGLTGQGLLHLKSSTALQKLHLEDCSGLTDTGLAHLRELTTLTELSLSWCDEITDAGLVHLHSLTGLQRLCLDAEGKITDQGIAALRAALPYTKVEASLLPGHAKVQQAHMA
jgi:hypothetical protein